MPLLLESDFRVNRVLRRLLTWLKTHDRLEKSSAFSLFIIKGGDDGGPLADVCESIDVTSPVCLAGSVCHFLTPSPRKNQLVLH